MQLFWSYVKTNELQFHFISMSFSLSPCFDHSVSFFVVLIIYQENFERKTSKIFTWKCEMPFTLLFSFFLQWEYSSKALSTFEIAFLQCFSLRAKRRRIWKKNKKCQSLIDSKGKCYCSWIDDWFDLFIATFK